MHRMQIKRAAALALAFVMTASSSGIVSLADELTGEAGQDYVYVTLYASGGKFVIPAEEPDVPIATPPVASPPVASPPVASPPVASPPVASPPEATPTETDHVKMAVEASPDGNFYLFEDTIDSWLSAEGIELETPDGTDYLSQPIWLTKEHDVSSKLSIPEEGIELSENGMKLYAGWLKETTPAADSDLADAAVTVAGLGKNETMKVEKLEEAKRKNTDDLVEALKKTAEYTNIDEEDTLQVDMDVPGYSGSGVSVSIDFADDFVKKTIEKSIVVLHYGKTKTEVIKPVYERGYNGEIRNITFTLKDFSPVVIAAVDKEVKVTLENVTGGYVIAYSEESVNGKTTNRYLPIGETVTMTAGTKLRLNADAFYGADFHEIQLTADGISSKAGMYDQLTVEYDTNIKGIFTKSEDESNTTSSGLLLKKIPAYFDKPGKTSTTLEVYKGGIKLNITDWKLVEDYGDEELFELSPGGILTSKQELELGSYRVRASASCDGLPREFYVSVRIGGSTDFYMFLGKTKALNFAEDWLGNSSIYNAGTKFGDVLADEHTSYTEPAMYGNYKFAGWYKDADPQLKPETALKAGVTYAYACFRNKDSDVWYDPIIKTFNDDDKTESTDKPTHSGSSSSSGGSSSSRLANGNLTGTWQQDGKGWRFKQSDGSYAANKWGKINNLWYYFGADTYMQTGWFFWNNCWYYLNPEKGSTEGVMQVGWQFDKTSQRWFCMSPSGVMLTGWQNVNDKWYYLNPVSDGTQGAMLSNQWIDGRFVNADGVMVK